MRPFSLRIIAAMFSEPLGYSIFTDERGELVSTEILDASRHVGESAAIALQRSR